MFRSKLINVAEILEVEDVATRYLARYLCEYVDSTRSDDTFVILDFSKIQSSSRSFLDELNARTKKEQKEKKILFQNMNKSLSTLLSIVNGSKKRKNNKYDPMKNTDINVCII
jgi:hypothetical protein